MSAREALAEQVRNAPAGGWRIVGTGAHDAFAAPGHLEVAPLATRAMNRVLDHDGPDHVVSVEAGATLAELNAALATAGQRIPYAPMFDGHGEATLGGLISMNLPHLAEGRFGSWSDWLLGAIFLRADGTFAKSGSRAVKNVAGYDVHRVAIGARGTLGVLVEVILRTATVPEWDPPAPRADVGHPWIQRVRRSDFAAAAAEAPAEVRWSDPETGLVVADVPPVQTRARFAHDWVLRGGCGGANFRWEDATAARLHARLRAELDPEGRLNPRAFPDPAAGNDQA